MEFVKFDDQQNKYFLEQDSQESPCILTLTDSKDDRTWFFNLNGSEYPYIFNINDLSDILKNEEGEYLTKAYVYIKDDSQSNTKGKTDCKTQATKLTIFFQNPKKITFFVNLIHNAELDDTIITFKCPKSGSFWQKEFLTNEIVQNLLIPNDNTEIVHYDFNSEKGLKESSNSEEINEQFNKLQIDSFLKLFSNLNGSISNDSNTNLLNADKEHSEDIMFNYIYSKFNCFHNLKCIKLLNIYAEFSSNFKSTGKSLVLTRDEFLSSPDSFKHLINRLFDNEQLSNKNFIILKYEKNEISKTNTHKIICCCSKSFGYNLQLSDLYYYNSDNTDVVSPVFLEAHNSTEIRRKIIDQAANAFEKIKILFNKKNENVKNEKYKNNIANDLLTHSNNFFTTNLALVFELVEDPLEKNNYLPVLNQIKTFEESLDIINEVFLSGKDQKNNNVLSTWHNFLFEKSFDYLLQNKTIAIVGFQYSDLDFYEYCKQNKIKLYFVGSDLPNDPDLDKYITQENLVNTYLYNFSIFEAEATRAAEKLKKLGVQAIITFSDECIPFKVLLQEKLNMKYNYRTTFEEAMVCKDKIEVTDKLQGKVFQNLNENITDCVSDAQVIEESDLDKITIDGKKVFKLSKACGSFGIEIIEPVYLNDEDNSNPNSLIIDQEKTREKIKKVYYDTKNYVNQLPIDMGYSLFFDYKYFLSTFLEGSEHTITLIIHEGKCIWYIISDVISSKTDQDEFYYEKACYFPSKVLRDNAERENVKDIVLRCMLELNLFHCCVNVDFKITENGIKIFDVNLRPGNWYYKDWAQKITGVSNHKAELCLNLPMKYHCVSMPQDSIIKGIPVFKEENLNEFSCDFIFKNANYEDGNYYRDSYAEVCWIERLFV